MPSTKSVGSDGMGIAFQRSWFGVGGTSLNGPLRMSRAARALNGLCIADGRIRYVHVERLTPRGAVNAVPFSSSMYKPNGGFCGVFCSRGYVPASASEANSFPKPDRYTRAVGSIANVGYRRQCARSTNQADSSGV